MLLAQILHQIRHQKPRPALAVEARISPHRLNAFCADSKPIEPTVEEWRRLTRCVYEVSPEDARTLAQHAATELFTVVDLSPPHTTDAPSDLIPLMLEFASRANDLAGKIADALKDGQVSAFEREDIELLASRVSSVLECLREATEGAHRNRPRNERTING